TTAPEV
ncbi:hypothetical protein BN1723_019593, partial [Verticillium longisporum]